MKKMVTSLSFLLVALVVLVPALATLAYAWGSGGAGAAGSAGAGAGAGASGAASGGGAAAGSAGASSGGSDSGGPASSSGSPSGSPGISAGPAGDDTGVPATAAPEPYRRVKSDKKNSQEVSPSASVATGQFVGRHTMTGTVSKVNPDKGTFSLKTSEGTLDLHAPPSALAGVQKGDRMAVEIAIQPVP
jgi:hypothetical protein